MSVTTITPNRAHSSVKKAVSLVGAPAQHNQTSRKGKKAWRKNIDIDAVEEGLEEMRVEERVTGYVLCFFHVYHWAKLGECCEGQRCRKRPTRNFSQSMSKATRKVCG